MRQINSAAFDVSAKHLKYEEKNNAMQIISGFPCSKKATRNKFLILTPINRTLAFGGAVEDVFYQIHPPLSKGLGFAHACYNLHQTTSSAFDI